MSEPSNGSKGVSLSPTHLVLAYVLLGAGPLSNLAVNMRAPATVQAAPAKLSDDGDFKVLVVEVRGVASDVKEIKEDQARQKDRSDSLWQRYNDQQGVIAGLIRDNSEQDEKIKALQGRAP